MCLFKFMETVITGSTRKAGRQGITGRTCKYGIALSLTLCQQKMLPVQCYTSRSQNW